MEDFVADTGTGTGTHLVDADGSLWRSYGVLTQPAFALIDAGGRVETVNGALGAAGLREAAQCLAKADRCAPGPWPSSSSPGRP